jgi:putative polyketide hydroxylase
MNGTQSDCSHYICSRGLCPVRLPHGSRRRGAPLIDYGAMTMALPVYRSSAVLGASEDISPSPPKELAGEPGTRAPHVAVTFGGREISTINLYERRFVLLARANGAAWISAAERVIQRLGVPLDVCIYRFGAELGGAETLQRWKIKQLLK